MKTIFRLSFLVAILAVILYSGCDPIEDTSSGDPRDKFVGEWQFIESGMLKSAKAQSYVVTIANDPGNSSQVLLKNFGNSGSQSIRAIGIVTSNNIVVNSQSMSNGWVVSGSGQTSNVTKTSMSWSYSITAGGDKENYTATATKL